MDGRAKKSEKNVARNTLKVRELNKRDGREQQSGLLSNVLLATSGEIIDFSGRQFTGKMLPTAYGNAASFKASLPGEVIAFEECSKIEIEEQLERDCHTAITHEPYKPHNWGAKVASNLCSLKFGASFCCVCMGTPNSAKGLKHCMRCKAILSCGKACQRYDWRRHKAECKA